MAIFDPFLTIPINQFCSVSIVVMMNMVVMIMILKRIFEKNAGYSMPRSALVTGSTVCHPTPLGTTSVPCSPHTSALGVPGESNAADA